MGFRCIFTTSHEATLRSLNRYCHSLGIWTGQVRLTFFSHPLFWIIFIKIWNFNAEVLMLRFGIWKEMLLPLKLPQKFCFWCEFIIIKSYLPTDSPVPWSHAFLLITKRGSPSVYKSCLMTVPQWQHWLSMSGSLLPPTVALLEGSVDAATVCLGIWGPICPGSIRKIDIKRRTIMLC